MVSQSGSVLRFSDSEDEPALSDTQKTIAKQLDCFLSVVS